MLANYDKTIKTYEKVIVIEKIETIGKPGLGDYLFYSAMIKYEL